MNIFNIVKSQVAIVDVVSDYATLKKAGSYYKGQCPFHSERTASFTVTPHKEIFYCFGCHVGGDAIAFIAHMEKCTPLEAVHHLAERYQLTLPEDDQASGRGAAWQSQQRHYLLCKKITEWCMQQAKQSPEARAYLAQRAMSQESITRFEIGYMPSGERARRDLLRYLQADGFLVQDLIAVRYFMDGRQGCYSPFESRIMFPIRDQVGRSCGFGGRIFEAGDTRAKYYNSHDHAQFSKGSILFGFDLAKRAMQSKNALYLVEGYTDCIALAQAGILNVVATLGTACTAEHLKLIARHVSYLSVVYDNDTAGVQATLRLARMCWESSLDLSIITLPIGEDPASYLAQGGLFSALKHEDVFGFYLRLLRGSFAGKSLTDKLEQIRELITLIATVEDPLKRDLIVAQAATACSLPQETLQKELRRLAKPDTTVGRLAVRESFQIKSQSEITVFTRSLFCAILSSSDRASEDDERCINTLLPESLQALFMKLQVYKQEVGEYHFSNFFVTLTAEERRAVTALLVQDSVGEGQVHQGGMSDLLVHAQRRYWKQAVKLFHQQLQEAQQQHDRNRTTEIVEQFTVLKKYMQQRGIL